MSDLFQIERIGKTPSHINWKEGQKDKIAELYLEGKSIREISRMFGGELHYNTIKKILDAYSITLRTRSQSKTLDCRNENIFENIDTEEKAYWLGFLSGDGCIYNNYVKISLKNEDIQHLEKFRCFIRGTAVQIKDDGKYCHYSIGCKKLAEDLKKHGCCERKSLILQVPDIDEKFLLDWFRGLYDADGGISITSKNKWQSYLTSTKEVCEKYVELLKINMVPFKEHRCENTWRVHFSGRRILTEKLNMLYHNNTATVYLERKHKLYEKLLASEFAEGTHRMVKQYDLNGNYLATYKNAAEAARAIGHPRSNSSIIKACKGKQEKALGYKWSY